MARVYIPTQMRDLTAGRPEVEVAGRNVREIVSALDEAFPGFAGRVLHQGKIAPGLAVSIDNEFTTLGLLASVAPDSEVHFVAAIGGG